MFVKKNAKTIDKFQNFQCQIVFKYAKLMKSGIENPIVTVCMQLLQLHAGLPTWQPCPAHHLTAVAEWPRPEGPPASVLLAVAPEGLAAAGAVDAAGQGHAAVAGDAVPGYSVVTRRDFFFFSTCLCKTAFCNSGTRRRTTMPRRSCHLLSS